MDDVVDIRLAIKYLSESDKEIIRHIKDLEKQVENLERIVQHLHEIHKEEES